MSKFSSALAALRSERESMLADLSRLNEVISALETFAGKPTATRLRTRLKGKPHSNSLKRSAAVRTKPRISAQGRRNIAEAQRKRWARVKAAGKGKAASNRKGGRTE